MRTSRSLLAQQPVNQVRQPAHDSLPSVAAESLGECAELLAITVTPCDRFLVRQVAGSFTNFVPICAAHQFVGYACSCEFEAAAQVCDGRLHQMMAAGRAESLVRQGFVRVENE